MAFIGLEDHTGSIEMLVFPRVLERFGKLMEVSKPVVITARVSLREEEDAKLICESVAPLLEAPVQNEKAVAPQKKFDPGLWLKIPSQNDPVFSKVINLLQIFDGQEPVHIYFEDTRRLMRNYPNLRIDMNEVLKNELVKLLSVNKVTYFTE